jgi:negative regulator of sigma E activity
MVIDMNEQLTDFERRVRETFDASVENLDAETRSRLNRARQAALAGREPARAPAWRSWAPAGAVAAALVAAVLWRVPGTGESPQVQINGEAPIEIVELAAEGEDFELMTEDPEFYTWVADQAGNGSNGVG